MCEIVVKRRFFCFSSCLSVDRETEFGRRLKTRFALFVFLLFVQSKTDVRAAQLSHNQTYGSTLFYMRCVVLCVCAVWIWIVSVIQLIFILLLLWDFSVIRSVDDSVKC